MLLLELAGDDEGAIASLTAEVGDEVTLVQRERFDGVSELMHVLVPLTTVSLGCITKIVVERIRARRHVTIRYKGVVITGVSEESAERILQELLDGGK